MLPNALNRRPERLPALSVSLCLLAFLLPGETGRADDRWPHSPSAITSVQLDVHRVDLCGFGHCVTVAGKRQVDLIAVANGDISSLAGLLLLEDLSARKRFTLNLVLGHRSFATAGGEQLPLFVPHDRVHLHFSGGKSGRLSAVTLRFDARHRITLGRKRAVLHGAHIRVDSYETVPLDGPVQVVSARSGATLSIADRFELKVPAGAVRRPTAIGARETETPRRLSSIYTIEPSGLALAEPATVRIRYRPDSIPVGYPAAELVILHDGDRIPTELDAGGSVATGLVRHFSAVWVSTPTPTTTEVAPGVEYTDRSMLTPAIHLVTIDRSLWDYELHVLTEPDAANAGYAYLRTVPELASANGALVAINGYTWGRLPLQCLFREGTSCSYGSTTIVDFEKLAENPAGPIETMMGLARQLGTGLRVQKFTQDQYNAGDFAEYRYHLLGSHTSLKLDGECLGNDETDTWSAIGYSSDKVVLISSDWTSRNGRFLDTDLCAVFDEFGVTDASRLDGGASPGLVVDGDLVNPQGNALWGTARPVATAIGLVPLPPLETLQVSTDGSEVRSSRSYSPRERVRIQVSGVVQWGGCDPVNCPGGAACNYIRYGDAHYLTHDCWASNVRRWFGFDISLFIDGANGDWGTYDPAHVYTIVRNGTGGPFRLRYNDCSYCYGDNRGSFTVKIFAAR